MWPLTALILAVGFSCGSAQVLQQSLVSITKAENKTVLITCHISISNFDKVFVHWYRRRPGAAPRRIAYMATRLFLENESDKGKFSMEKDLAKSECTLTVGKVTAQDAATYYCASWDGDEKIFGSGTKLIVSDKASSAPENFEILQEEHEKQLVYVCLIEKFYPEVIRVKWIDEKNKEVTQNVVKGDVWKSPDEDKYSVSSWLSVSLESKNKKYFCNYDHESGERSLPTQASSESSPWEQKDCGTQSGNSTVFNRDHLTHKAAQLVYVVLLLKSSMYYVIVLFFFFKYKTSSAAKPMGKKT